jgi:transcriptional antiterminator RfaH
MTDSPPQQPADGAWFLLQTKPRLEESALVNLENQGYQCFLPRLRRERVSRGKVTEASEPLFARYLFIRLGTSLDSASWGPIRSTKGVSQLVRFGEQVAKASDALIEALRGAEDSSRTETLFSAGEPVTILDGPFKGLRAIYQAHDAQQRAFVLIEILKKTTRLNVELTNLSAVR